MLTWVLNTPLLFGNLLERCPENLPLEKSPPPRKSLRENCAPENYLFPGNIPLKLSPRKNASQDNCPSPPPRPPRHGQLTPDKLFY